MTVNKIRILPYKYNLRCSVPGCKNKGDFEIRRRPGSLMVMCEACMLGIGEFISGTGTTSETGVEAENNTETGVEKPASETAVKKTRKRKAE